MKVKSVRISFKDAQHLHKKPDTIQVHEGQANVSELHYIVRDGVACINYKDTYTGDRIGDSYPLLDIERIQTII